MRSDRELPQGLINARRTAATARALMALGAIGVVVGGRSSGITPGFAVIGFAVIFATSLVQLLIPRPGWLVLEESLAPVSAVLIIGLGPERVTTMSLLWASTVACGVLARGGRQHWYGRAVLILSLVLPIALHHDLTSGYAMLCLATIALLLTCGRITRELREMHDRARWDADHDSLTGILSRGSFRLALDEVADEVLHRIALTGPGALVLVLVDLDNFGQINKSAGHAAGDALLRAVAERMRTVIGPDGLLGRLGGDEFAAVVRAQDPAALGADLLKALDTITVGAPAVGASAGVALIPRDGEDADALLRAVDVALRVAKRSGRRRVSVYEGESFSDHGPGGARETLERLIAGDGLEVVVQPIVTVPACVPHAYEALARFRTRGSSSPLHWFALADEFGVRERLELACLRAALHTYASRPPGTSLSVNLSGPLLLDHRTHALLEGADGLDGLILEMTENSLLEDTPGIHAEISRLLH